MVSEEENQSFGPEVIPSTSVEPNPQTGKPQTIATQDASSAAPIVVEARKSEELIEEPAGVDGPSPSTGAHSLPREEAASPLAPKQEMTEAGPGEATLSDPKTIKRPEVGEAIEPPDDADGPPPLLTERELRVAEAAPPAAVRPVFVEKALGFLAERPLPLVELAPRVLRYRTRRDVLLFGAGAVAAAAGAGLLLPQGTLGRLGVQRRINPRGKEWLLNAALRIDDDVAEALYSANRMVPTYTKSQITPIKNNYNGATPEPSYISGWNLTLEGLDSGMSICLDIRRLMNRFPMHEQITRFVCVEGWTAIAWWAGLRFSDLLRAYTPMSQAKWARVESSVNLDNSGNLDPYFVSIDLAKARHPQTLLATHHNGQPLTVEHGAPLRLLVPVKLGLKNVKATTRIIYSAKEPQDYWTQYQYSSYDGI